MGMFDKPQFLTGGDDPFVRPGDTFWLHDAKLDGTVEMSGKTMDQAKLLVSRDLGGEQVTVFTAGIGVVNQVRRMNASDRAQLPLEVRLDQVPSKQGSPTNVLTPAAVAAPAAAAVADPEF